MKLTTSRCARALGRRYHRALPSLHHLLTVHLLYTPSSGQARIEFGATGSTVAALVAKSRGQRERMPQGKHFSRTALHLDIATLLLVMRRNGRPGFVLFFYPSRCSPKIVPKATRMRRKTMPTHRLPTPGRLPGSRQTPRHGLRWAIRVGFEIV